MPRQIFIGDIHGCYDEWMDLLEKVNYDGTRDELYLVGDVINRGPKSHFVLDFLLKHPKIQVVCGNHEHFFLEESRQARFENFSKIQPQLQTKMAEYLEMMESWPHYIDRPNWTLVHAGFRPQTSLKNSDPVDLCTLRKVKGSNGEEKPWYQLSEATKIVVFGHWAKKGLVKEGFYRGLDSGCVYGRSLSALVLPEDKIVSVAARKIYYDTNKKMEMW